MSKTPRITIMGEEVPWDEAPGNGVLELDHYFTPVRLTQHAINEASKIVPVDTWKKRGLCTWLQAAADHVFKKRPEGKMEARHGVMKYVFEFDYDGPVLKTVSL